MATQPDDPAYVNVPHRRRRSSAWKRTPLWVKITVGTCLGLLILGLFSQDWLREHGWLKGGRTVQREPPRHIAAGQAFDAITAKLPAFDLVLSKSELNEKTRRIEGVITNQSGREHADISIVFADLMARDTATVTIPKLGTHASVPFATDPLPPEVRGWQLKRLVGTPR
jgi:hypothetical protein